MHARNGLFPNRRAFSGRWGRDTAVLAAALMVVTWDSRGAPPTLGAPADPHAGQTASISAPPPAGVTQPPPAVRHYLGNDQRQWQAVAMAARPAAFPAGTVPRQSDTLPHQSGSVLDYATYLGGSGLDSGDAIVVDSAGNTYVAGYTDSDDFPLANPAQPANGGGRDAFVAKFNAAHELVYATYLGGGGQELVFGLAVDAAGQAHVVGRTLSTDFPTWSAFQPAPGSNGDGFVVKLSPEGRLVYASYLGGSGPPELSQGFDTARGVAVDAGGSAYVVGNTSSPDFPTRGSIYPFQDSDAFLTKLSPEGQIEYSTFIGDKLLDDAFAVAVDGTGSAFVAGITRGTHFPTTPGAYQRALKGTFDSFVVQVSADGGRLEHATYFGGDEGPRDQWTQVNAIALDADGNVYLTGHTGCPEFPTVAPPQAKYGGGEVDGFLAKLSPALDRLLYSTYLGGRDDDTAQDLVVDSDGRAYVAGTTHSADFPLMAPLRSMRGGPSEAFVTVLSADGTAFEYSTFLGGNNNDGAAGLDLDADGRVYVTGDTASPDFPATTETYHDRLNGVHDAYWARILQPGAVTYQLDLEAEQYLMPPTGDRPSELELTATVTDSRGRPAMGEVIQLGLDPTGLGAISPISGVTDANGQLRATYRAPHVSQLKGLDRVTITAENRSHEGQAWIEVRFSGYELSLTSDTEEVAIYGTSPDEATVTATERDPWDRPVAGDLIEFRLEPPDLGRLVTDRGVTNAAGQVRVVYRAPRPEEVKGRERVVVYAVNRTRGGERRLAIRFLGLEVWRTVPYDGQLDVDYEGLSRIVVYLDEHINPATVSRDSVVVSTEWHGDLGAVPRAGPERGQIIIDLLGQPIPDVGLKVKVRLESGERGVRSLHGAVPLLAPYELRFATMPRLQPAIVVSQGVDEPRDPLWGYKTLVPKTYVVRVEAGIPEDSELDDERVKVTLAGPNGSRDYAREHTYYPGRWPPRVPEAAANKGNSANFVVGNAPTSTYRPGQVSYRVELRPVHAANKAFTAHVDDINMNNFERRMLRVLGMQIVNSRVPASAWRSSRTNVAAWISASGAEASDYLPVTRVAGMAGRGLMRPECRELPVTGVLCDDAHPWTHWTYWVRQTGRAGYLTQLGWQYIVLLVPQGWFDQLADHPSLSARPDAYHHVLQSKLWSPLGVVWPGQSVSIVEHGAPAGVLLHAIGDEEGLAHSTAATDPLRGYSIRNDKLVYADGQRWLGAYLSFMNYRVGVGQSWITARDYTDLLGRWSSRTCGMPPCPAEGNPVPATNGLATSRQAANSLMAEEDAPQAVLVVSGVIRTAGGTTEAFIEPLLRGQAPATAEAGGSGSYAVELRDATGATLTRFAFSPTFGPVTGGELADFLLAVPDDPRTAAVVLAQDGTPLTTRTRSPNPPTVAFDRPAPGGSYDGMVDVAWSGADADGDPLTYHLQFSGDGGASWLPLAADTEATSYRLTSAEVANGPDARLRVVASDGFNTAEATLSFALANPLEVLATQPAVGALDVPARTPIQVNLRDPLDPATADGGALVVTDSTGVRVAGTVAYEPADYSVIFEPDEPLAENGRFEARLSRSVRTLDGRTLAAEHVWTFQTRGIRSVFLPLALNGAEIAAVPARTARPTSTPAGTATPTATPFATATPWPTSTPSVTPSATAPAASPTPSSTPSTSPLTPSPTSSPPLTASPPVPATPTATATLAPGEVSLESVWIADRGGRTRSAFVPLDELTLWLKVVNPGLAPVQANLAFEVRDPDGFRWDELSWSGSVVLEPDKPYWSLEVALPTDMPAGEYTYTGSVTYGGQPQTKISLFYLAHNLELADDFSDPGSGWPATSAEPATYDAGYMDGTYRLLMKVADRAAWSAPGTKLTDGVIEADVWQESDVHGEAGLVFGVSDDGRQLTMFTADNAGRYRLARQTDSGWVILRDWTASPALNVGRAQNHLMLARRGAELRLYANGQRLDTVTDGEQVGGRFGAMVISFDESFVDARFDDYRAYWVAGP